MTQLMVEGCCQSIGSRNISMLQCCKLVKGKQFSGLNRAGIIKTAHAAG